MDGALAAGKKIKGNLIYQVPKDWKELEIDIDLTVLSLNNEGKLTLFCKTNKNKKTASQR